jgi:hypothetical protein
MTPEEFLEQNPDFLKVIHYGPGMVIVPDKAALARIIQAYVDQTQSKPAPETDPLKNLSHVISRTPTDWDIKQKATAELTSLLKRIEFLEKLTLDTLKLIKP